jgi:hypothetical protein
METLTLYRLTDTKAGSFDLIGNVPHYGLQIRIPFSAPNFPVTFTPTGTPLTILRVEREISDGADLLLFSEGTPNGTLRLRQVSSVDGNFYLLGQRDVTYATEYSVPEEERATIREVYLDAECLRDFIYEHKGSIDDLQSNGFFARR